MCPAAPAPPRLRRILLYRLLRAIALAVIAFVVYVLLRTEGNATTPVQQGWHVVLSLFLGVVVVAAATPTLRRLLRLKWRQVFW